MHRCYLFWVMAAIFLGANVHRSVHAGDTVKPVNLDKVNTAADEEDPCPTPDGYGLLYVVRGKSHYDIYLARRSTINVPYTAGKPFIADRGFDVRSPFMHQTKYYFASNEVPEEKFAKFKNFDVYMQIGNQAPLFLLGDINTKVDEMYPWVTPGGKEFYFSRKTEDGWKQYVANGPVPGPIGKVRPLDFPANVHRATVAGNGLTMYLQGPLEEGRTGIFRSKRAKVGADWSRPEPVAALNHPESKKGDMQPALSADATRLYFASDRPGGKGGLDIWVVLTSQLK